MIELDISAEQLSTNVPTEVGLVGDGQTVMAQLTRRLVVPTPWSYPAGTPWRARSPTKIEANRGSMEAMGR